jgi:hypothetical protein
MRTSGGLELLVGLGPVHSPNVDRAHILLGRKDGSVTEAEQAKAFLGVLFRAGEIFEVRLKTQDQKGAKQIWLPTSKLSAFVDTHLTIHNQNKRHVWVGVLPRTEIGKAVPKHGRVLWVDLDSTIKDVASVTQAIANANLPPPTMVVNSGNGFHLYWALKRELPPELARNVAKGVHALLPSDATHDPTRVMRVPGTYNFKDPDNPKPCTLHEYHPDRVYDVEEFPQKDAGTQIIEGAEEAPPSKPLSQEDFDLFVSNWLDGQKHTMAVGVSGYLRKSLNYGKNECLDVIRRIHETAGYSWPDDNLIRVVEDTYAQMLGKVAGLSTLRELGVIPSVKDSIQFTFLNKKPKKISIINFSQDIAPQEFLLDGLVGPGLLTLWAAEPKTGKSFAAMQLGHAIATGQTIWGFQASRPARVLYFQGELSRGMVAERAKNMFGDDILKNPRQFGMTDKPSEVIDLTQNPEILSDLAENYEVVIVDPISAFSGNDENSSSTVRSTLSTFDQLKARGKAIILVHHTKKLQTTRDGTPIPPSFSDIRGSSAWFAMADAIGLQYRIGDEGNTRVKFMFRAAPEREPLNLYRLPHGGFTSNYNDYLRFHDTLRVNFDRLN